MTIASSVGATEDYFGEQFSGITPKNRTTSPEHEIGLGEGEPIRFAAKARRTFRLSRAVVSRSAPTANATEVEADYLEAASTITELDDVRGAVRSFAELAVGWDGPDSLAALPGVIDDALEVLQNWPQGLDTPEPVMAYDGSVSLELYDEEGLTRGGVEFKGNHKAVYTVVSESKILSSGTFNAGLLSEIIRSIRSIRGALSTDD